VARYLVDDYQQLKTFYQLSEDPEILEPTMTDKWIENFAGFLASPMVSFWLLFGAMFFLSSEMSQPGLGVPGFIGSMLLVLFFWSQFLDGNADWLEIILFVAGVACILVEVFVIPGFGMFGIIGLLMMVVSIVLATQSFIIPRNSEEFNRIPVSLSMVVGASFGCIAALVVFRRFLPHMPIVKRIMLSPPGHEDDGLNKLENRESMVQWEHLLNQKGQAITRLVPAGKARIGDEVIDVITDGRLMEKGSVLIVTKVQGNRVVVAPVD
jgi:membrane-bound ClpP family serine protease